jgi:hypothetical protein
MIYFSSFRAGNGALSSEKIADGAGKIARRLANGQRSMPL